ncbi:hypothetical protein T439DRAFT_325453 [Meredithblackwellia eburnea MCA 4105]
MGSRKKVIPTLRYYLHLPPKWLAIACLKGGTAATLCVVLVFLRKFDELIETRKAIVLNSTIIVVIIGSAGRTIGGCIETLWLGGAGLALGCLCFYVLGVLGKAGSTVGQGFVFALFVYLMALVRHQGARYISFYLYAVLFAFQGIYTTVADDPRDKDQWLLAYFQAYAWGFAIVLATNLLVWPVWSEDQLRELVIDSLQSQATLTHLLFKHYTLTLTPTTRAVRNHLITTLRASFSSLSTRLNEVRWEIGFGRNGRSHAEWRMIVAKVRGLQQALITSASALDLMDEVEGAEGRDAVRKLLIGANEGLRQVSGEDGPGDVEGEGLSVEDVFVEFRQGIDLVIASIIDSLEPQTTSSDRQLFDPESQSPIPPTTRRTSTIGTYRNRSPSISTSDSKTREIESVEEGLRKEVERSLKRLRKVRARATDGRHQLSRMAMEDEAGGAPVRHFDVNGGPLSYLGMSGAPQDSAVEVVTFQRAWERFASQQTEAIINLIRGESLSVGDTLRIGDGMPSLKSMYADRLPKAWTSSLVSSTPLRKLQPRMSSEGDVDISAGSEKQEVTGDVQSSDGGKSDSTVGEKQSEGVGIGLGEGKNGEEKVDDQAPCSEALTKSYSLLFGLGQLTEELVSLHKLATNSSSSEKWIRFHIFNQDWKFWRWNTKETGMTLVEALSALRGVEYHSPKVPLIERFMAVEKWFRTDRSLYAFKVALGATVYSVLLLAPTPRKFYIEYSMTSSLITVIVAIAPSLGQTAFTFILQLTGTGVGSLYGMIMLEIFKNCGGYKYNPYGLSVAMFVWGFLTSYHFYKEPRYYTGALLATNGAGSIMIQEWLYNELPEMEGPYPSPPLRAGQAIAAMCISILIAALFQIFVFRAPARHQLRLKIADVTNGLSNYNTLLQSNINCVAPADERKPPPPEALDKIQNQLSKWETKLQADILALGPLFQFAEMEPHFTIPFKGAVLRKIIRSHQIILDRLREGRTAIGRGFNQTVHHDFASTLYPYRLHSQRLSRTLFWLGTTSLKSKTPLPRDVPSSKSTWASFEHDALVLSRRLSLLPHGDEELRKPGFLRYWFYLVAIGSVSTELEQLESYLVELFALPEVANPFIL